MARWKLATAHYINILQGSEWEYSEVNRKTGKPIRRRFEVPTLLDPKDQTCWTNRWGNSKDDEEGEIIVCIPGKGEPGDLEFLGEPTPDMIPVDDEAKEISASYAQHWSYKPDVQEPGQFSQSLIDGFRSEIAESQSRPVEVPGLSDLVTMMAKQTEAITKLLETRRV